MLFLENNYYKNNNNNDDNNNIENKENYYFLLTHPDCHCRFAAGNGGWRANPEVQLRNEKFLDINR